ncbi:RNA exonuclease 5 [Stomoxys calcitrans]|uniref:RNA exonuclease 5 n=1 Tax=Stomoxys calcitrans TaxID=35570 RepID=UPI0027E287AB|nr:RNA exonuclease 5 [Stomoxys calcitrans]XP_059216799.1 RNA exonuclease 5 [Stomoxys calcitrans]
MHSLSSKQLARKEKKKKKLAALASLVKSNDQDRIEEIMTERTIEPSRDNGAENDDGFTKVTHKKKQGKKKADSSNVDEPIVKKQKTSKTLSDATDSEEMLKLNLTEDQYKLLKKELRERKRALESVPYLRLREAGEKALLIVDEAQRQPLFLTDIQHLVMAALLGRKSPCKPERWCFFDEPDSLSHTVVVCLDGLSLFHYLSNKGKFQKLDNIFESSLEVIMPQNVKEDGFVMAEELIQVPMTNVQAFEYVKTHGSLEAAIELNKDPTLIIKSIFPVENKEVVQDLHPNDKFPRTKLLLSALQMIEEGYPMPLRGELSKQYNSYMLTRKQYAPVTNRSPLFGVDCEMCHTSSGVNELTRISIVNENLETVYESMVRPDNKIIDYLTQFSGITAEMMRTVTKRLSEVQHEVRDILPDDAILVGQSLNCDLNAMRMMHPYCIDTSVCFNLSGVRKSKARLQKLAFEFLKETIQEHASGHDSTEDSISCLKLVKLKLANSLEFGDEVLIQKKRLQDIMLAASGEAVRNNMLAHASKRDRHTAIITSKPLPSIVQNLIEKAEQAFPDNAVKPVRVDEVNSNKEAVRKCREIALENALTICNLHFTPEDMLASTFEGTVENINKWVAKIWKSMAHKGLLVVLMGGAKECSTGMANIAIKRNVADVAFDHHLTI